MKNRSYNSLKKSARNIRLNILKSIFIANSGHIGGSFSCVEIIAYLYLYKYRKYEDFIFILSKGHAAPALYSVLYQKGILSKKSLLDLRKIGSRTQGHPDKRYFNKLYSSTGSLGQGLSIGIGYAISNKLKKNKKQTYVLIGDGEIQEGQIWEALLYISANKINNLVLLIDSNRFQNELSVEETLNLSPLSKKLKNFGFEVMEVNGHNFKEIDGAISKIKRNTLPKIIILNTIKGKGVSFMENNNLWHANKLTKNDYESAINEISK
tara:strand:+ start:1057 stop:1854 length:798 start_codon:yes stop_codon:yes gene_type:complete